MRSLSLRRVLAALALAGPLALGGCGDDSAFAEQGAEAADTVAREAMFLVAAMNGMTPSTTPEEAAEDAAAQSDDFFGADCHTATVDGAAVTYELTECDGPFGYTAITGSVTTTYRSLDPGVGFDIVANDLTIDEAPARFTLAGEISSDVRSVQVSVGNAEIVGARGLRVTRSGDYRLRWGPSTRCAAVDGTFPSVVQEQTWDTTLAEWQVCPRGCPSMGGQVTLVGEAGTVIVSYDGTSLASWTSAGAEGSIRLVCEE
jgi:hypothetical protein